MADLEHGERIALLEGEVKNAKSSREHIREDMLLRRKEINERISSIEALQKKHALILYAGYILLTVCGVLFTMFGRDLVIHFLKLGTGGE